MKKISKILSHICVLCCFVRSFGVAVNCKKFAKAEQVESVHAKVLSECALYKNKDLISSLDNIYFNIPETYFVVVLQTISDDCLKVQYDKYVGYIDSSKVELAKFVPIVKFLENITFDIKENSGTQIWQYPSSNSSVFTTIDAGSKNIKYVASVFGEVPSGGKSNIWYYVQYVSETNSTSVYEGYVYSENTTNLSEIISNKENNPEIISEEIENEKIFYISSTLKTIVVAIIAIPIILFFAIILYKIIAKLKNNTKYRKISNSNNDSKNNEFDKAKTLKSIEKYKNLTLVKKKNFQPEFDEFDDEELL